MSISLLTSLFAHAQMRPDMTDELLYDYAVGKIAVEIDDLQQDILKTYAPTPEIAAQIGEIQKKKSLQAMFDRMDEKTKKVPAAFVAKVSSDYFDENLKKQVTVSGMGTLVKRDNELFLISASHVTQGQNIRVTDSDKKVYTLKPNQRLANVEQDIEILSLDGDPSGALNYDKQLKKIRSNVFSLKPTLEKYGTLVPYASYVVSMNQHVAVLPTGASNIKFALGGFSQHYMIEMAHLEGKTLEDRAAYVWDRMGNIAKPLVGDGWISVSRMPPGLSGAPLIRDNPTLASLKTGKYVWELDGLVLAQHRTQLKTFYADMKQINALIKKYDEGTRGHVNKARWRMAGGLTFRDYGNGLLETILVTKPSANYLVQDSGNAVSVDSGNAVSVDSGNAVSVDSGNAVSVDSGAGGKQKVQVLLGNQVKDGQTVLGRWMEKDGEKFPVISMPFIERAAFELNTDLKGSISDKTDLYELAQAKTQFMNRKQYNLMNLQCYYELTEKGLAVAVMKGQEASSEGVRGVIKTPIYVLKITRADLRKGFSGNKMVYNYGNGMVDFTGVFITDLSAATKISGLENVQGPSVNLQMKDMPFALTSQINCFSSTKAREHILRSFIDDYIETAHKNMGTFYGVQ